MADKTVVVHIPDYSGSTLTIELKDKNTGTVLNGTGDDLTEQPEAGTFHGTVTEAITGELLAFIKEGTNIVANGYVKIDADVEGYYVVGDDKPFFQEVLDAVDGITIDNAAIASAVRVELTDELDIINNIPASFDFISEQIDGIQTVVYVSPAYITVPMSIKAKTIRPFYKDTSRLGPIGYFDSTKTPINLSTFDGNMYLVVEDKETSTVLLYDEDPTYVEHNLYIDPSQESVESSSNNICWALRLISNDKVLMEGPWEIQNAAYGTSP